MRRILLDENVPVGLREQLSDCFVTTVPEMGWSGLSNGELLAAAESAGFDLMVTGDQNIRYQNDLSGLQLGVVVLDTTHWPTIRAHPEPTREAVERTARGSYAVVAFPRPRRRGRRPPPRNGAA